MRDFITPEDIRNPDRQSGYNYVNDARGPNERADGSAERWRATRGKKARGTGPTDWRGPTRKTPREAARDYCNWVNGDPTLRMPKRLRSAGHKVRRTPRTPTDAEVALRKLQREALAEAEGRQGYVYCIAEESNFGEQSYLHMLGVSVGYLTTNEVGAAYRTPITGKVLSIGAAGVKIGYSVDPHARVAELQTGNPRKLKLVGYFKGAPDDEARIHRRFHKDNVLQEWFRPSRELLSLFANKEG